MMSDLHHGPVEANEGSAGVGLGRMRDILAMTRTQFQSVAVTPPHRNITSSGFDTLLQEQEADDQVHAGEVLSYLAIESGYGDGWDASTFGGVTNQQKSVPLIGGFTDIPVFLGSIQTFNGFDTSALRYGRVNNGTVSMWLNIEEEKSKDTETKHGAETVGYLAHRHGDLTGESWDAASSGWITPIGNLNRPTDVRVTAEGNSLWVRWQDNAEGESGYVVETSADGGATWQTAASLVADSVQTTIGGLETNTNFGVRLTAKSGTGGIYDSPATGFGDGDVQTGADATQGLYRVRMDGSAKRGHAVFDPASGQWDFLQLTDADASGNQYVQAASWQDAVRQAISGGLLLDPNFGSLASLDALPYWFGTNPDPQNVDNTPDAQGFMVGINGQDFSFPNVPVGTQMIVLEDQYKLGSFGYYENPFDFNDYGKQTDVKRVPVELDIDSNNDGEINEDDDSIEDVADSPGNIFAVNSGDDDLDGVTDWADFGGVRGPGANLAHTLAGNYTKLLLNVQGGLANGGSVRFKYDASPHTAVIRNIQDNDFGPDHFSLPDADNDGFLRIWKGDSDVTSDEDAIVMDQEYDLVDLVPVDGEGNSTQSHGPIELWLEAVRPSAAVGDARVVVEYLPPGGGSNDWVEADAVRASAVEVSEVVWEPWTATVPAHQPEGWTSNPELENEEVDETPRTRIFSGSVRHDETPEVARTRQLVKLTARLSLPLENVPLSFLVGDPDDYGTEAFPEDLNAPDAERNPDGVADRGGDNRERGGLYYRDGDEVEPSESQERYITTDSEGRAETEVLVTLNPGDDFIGVVQVGTNTTTPFDQSLIDAKALDAVRGPSGYAASDRLIVWRKGYIKEDSMGRPTYTGTVARSQLAFFTPTADSSVPPIPITFSSASSPNEPWRVEFTSATSGSKIDYSLDSYRFDSEDGGHKFTIDISENGGGQIDGKVAVGDSYRIYFDWNRVPADEDDPESTDGTDPISSILFNGLDEPLAEAYLKPVFDYDAGVPGYAAVDQNFLFSRNFGASNANAFSAMTATPGGSIAPTPNFFFIHILNAYDSTVVLDSADSPDELRGQLADNDFVVEGERTDVGIASLGVSDAVRGKVLVFAETTRDVAAQHGWTSEQAEYVTLRVVLHEMGHVLHGSNRNERLRPLLPAGEFDGPGKRSLPPQHDWAGMWYGGHVPPAKKPHPSGTGIDNYNGYIMSAPGVDLPDRSTQTEAGNEKDIPLWNLPFDPLSRHVMRSVTFGEVWVAGTE